MTVETKLAELRMQERVTRSALQAPDSGSDVMQIALQSQCPGAATNSPGRAHHLARGGEMSERICSIEGCERPPANVRGWCWAHYHRWRKHGDPLTTTRRVDMTHLERFHDSYAVTDLGCWQWQRHIRPDGYATFHERQRPLLAHRWGYEHIVGVVPEGLQLDHLCRNRSCVNPAHLEPVTAKENVRRGLVSALRHTKKRPT